VTAELVPMPAPPRDLLRVARFYPFEERGRRLLFVVDNAAFCALDDASWRVAQHLMGRDRVRRSELLALVADLGPTEAEETIYGFEQLEVLLPHDFPLHTVDRAPVVMEPASSLVLHVSHDCNMRCGYCYADFGRYGGDAGYMAPEQAVAHVAKFFEQLGPGRAVHITFFGGEPLMNMPVVYAAHAYAKARALEEGRGVSFGLTTNGTLLTRELVAFFEAERFALTVSIDGPPDVNDRLRPIQDGSKSYDVIVQRVKESGLRPAARVTLTRKCLDVPRIVRHLIDAGFREVGVSPVASGHARFDLDDADLQVLLQGLTELADDFVAWAKEGKVFPFSNIRAMVEQVAAGDPRSMPCGAVTRLVAADNKGDLYACHRLVGRETFKVGTLEGGLDEGRRFDLLKRIQPRDRVPCQTCWARTLCGGGCHHIAWLQSGQGDAPWTLSPGFCDFLRGWYRLGLHTYARLLEEAPEVLGRLAGQRAPSACSQPQGQ
jgi:uncharacterized protein